MTGLAIRFSIASIVLLALALAKGVRLGREPRERWLWLIQATTTFGIPYGIVFWAEQWVPSGLVAVLFATFPLFVIPVGWIFLPEEKVGPWALFGILLGFGGVAVIFSDNLSLGSPQVLIPAALTLLSPFFAAFGQVSAKRWGKGIHSFSLASIPMGLAAIGVGVMAFIFERHEQILWEPRPIIAMIYLSLFGSVLTFSIFYWLLNHLASFQISLVTYCTPVVAVTIGTLFFDEPLTLRMLLGSTLVLCGVLFAARPKS